MTSAAGPGEGTPGVVAKAGCPLLGILFGKKITMVLFSIIFQLL